jgi:hypothetical protein
MTTLSEEQHHALLLLVQRKHPNRYVWYSLTYDIHQSVHIWTCHICHEFIHWGRQLSGSGSILCAHGIRHLKEHNLLIFV